MRQSHGRRRENVPVPDFLPFRGLRYVGRDLSPVTAPPYDVIDDEECSAFERADPHNAVRLILPRESASTDRYAAAAASLARWRSDGVLQLDADPAFYEYRMAFDADDGRHVETRGVIGALQLPTEPGAGDILPHERTLPKARSDRLALLRATRANLDPIWIVSLAEGLTEFLDLIEDDNPPVVSLEDDGTRHELWGHITTPEHVREIQSLIAGAPVVVADGHHRFETACKYRDEHPDDLCAGAIMALVVALADEQLAVHPIHRLLTDVADVRDRLAPVFTVEPAGPNEPDGVRALVARLEQESGIGLVDRDGLALLRPRADRLSARLEALPAPLRHVDSALFDVGIRPLVDDASLSYRADAATVASLVDKGTADAAVLLKPCAVDAIRDAALAGVRMPEKTTYFAPKPRTGMVFRVFDDQV
jgi:uncharacterized protein (DUF1015 family)